MNHFTVIYRLFHIKICSNMNSLLISCWQHIKSSIDAMLSIVMSALTVLPPFTIYDWPVYTGSLLRSFDGVWHLCEAFGANYSYWILKLAWENRKWEITVTYQPITMRLLKSSMIFDHVKHTQNTYHHFWSFEE